MATRCSPYLPVAESGHIHHHEPMAKEQFVLSKASAARGMELMVLGLRKDIMKMDIPEYMQSFPAMTKQERAIFKSLISMKHEVFLRVDEMLIRVTALQRLIT